MLDAFSELKTLTEALLGAPEDDLAGLLARRESVLARLEQVSELPEDIKPQAHELMQAVLATEAQLKQRVQAFNLKKSQILQEILSLKDTQQTLSGYKPPNTPPQSSANHWG